MLSGSAGGSQTVASGGRASVTVIFSDAGVSGTQYVKAGGQVLVAKIFAGGVQHLRQGGSASGTVLSGGVQHISSGAVANDVSVLSGGAIHASSGGIVSSASVFAGGQERISAGAVDSVVFVAGTQHVWGSALSAKVRSGGLQSVAGFASGTVVSAGDRLRVNRGSAVAAKILAGGTGIVFSAGFLSKGTVSSGGSLNLSGTASAIVLKAGAVLSATAGAVLADSCRMDAVKAGTGALSLASGGTLVISGKASAIALALSASVGLLVFSGAGAKLQRISLTKDTAVSFDIGKLKAGTITVLKVAEKNTQKAGAFSISVVAQQQMGSYGIAQNVVQAKNTAWSIGMGSAVLGSAFLNGSGFSKNGVTYSLTATKDRITLSLACKAGGMLRARRAERRSAARRTATSSGPAAGTTRSGTATAGTASCTARKTGVRTR
ncbi:MAG: hypothetical protein K6E40_09915 [Desulfovibrio sp.]|nr:hypothetical protein [Desulfovibrio sp.]